MEFKEDPVDDSQQVTEGQGSECPKSVTVSTALEDVEAQ
jgi:hypothetical protein